MLEIFGQINRENIARKFGVSDAAGVSPTSAFVIERWPDLIDLQQVN